MLGRQSAAVSLDRDNCDIVPFMRMGNWMRHFPHLCRRLNDCFAVCRVTAFVKQSSPFIHIIPVPQMIHCNSVKIH
ncbi:hypothetical protein CEXT_177811 [Caerostris extrusa]|uniref:Uncharacterized protein n=1 Tax=Caerostris extrusa TaxID=172846 RepID=A0AAV4TB32_CAEEX|nr:hypothetical protein CEXT_177811 [Caerostris extrusa]